MWNDARLQHPRAATRAPAAHQLAQIVPQRRRAVHGPILGGEVFARCQGASTESVQARGTRALTGRSHEHDQTAVEDVQLAKRAQRGGSLDREIAAERRPAHGRHGSRQWTREQRDANVAYRHVRAALVDDQPRRVRRRRWQEELRGDRGHAVDVVNYQPRG
eukprot:6170059-Prymnesium_polylepis.2